MKIVADTHLHIYPFYDIAAALDTAITRLGAAAPDAIRVGCLTERYDCDVFNQLVNEPPREVTDRFALDPEANTLKVQNRQSGDELLLLPGQQVITSENLEILVLNCATRIKEGRNADVTVRDALSVGGVPVIAWGLGKWLGKRGEIVSKLVDTFGPGEITLGDTTMRPWGWPEPAVYGAAARKGIRRLFGSDPLPFGGEEKRPGSYATLLECDDQSVSPSDIISGILNREMRISALGRRNTPFEVAGRMYNHRRSRKISGH